MSTSPVVEESRDTVTIDRTALRPEDFRTHGVIARRLVDDRRDREATIGVDIVCDLGWNMMLDIFISMTDGRRMSDVAVSLASGAPPSTAARFIAFLVATGDLVREPDPRDDRRSLVTLSKARFTAVTAYLGRVADRWDLAV
jgi:hypothetical protein